jgi:hypothetical protein
MRIVYTMQVDWSVVKKCKVIRFLCQDKKGRILSDIAYFSNISYCTSLDMEAFIEHSLHTLIYNIFEKI